MDGLREGGEGGEGGREGREGGRDISSTYMYSTPAAAPLPPRPHSASSSGSSLPPRLGSSGVKAVPNPYSLEQEDTDAIYEAHESDSFGGGTPVTPSFTPSSAIDIGPIEEQGWYWGNITRWVWHFNLVPYTYVHMHAHTYIRS